MNSGLPDELRNRLEQAHRRVEASVQGSPEWAAAVDAVESVEREAAAEQRLASGSLHDVEPFGPLILPDGCVVFGLVATRFVDAHSFIHDAVLIAARVRSRREYADGVEALARQYGLVLEASGDGAEFSCYAWESP